MHTIAALYHFAKMKDVQILRAEIEAWCIQRSIQGTLILAPEGINGTVAAEGDNIKEFLIFLKNLPGLSQLEAKISYASSPPFKRLKVKCKPEIVTMGIEGVNPEAQVGTYVSPKDWNALIEDPEVLVIDTRNDFECRMGSFKNAVNPQTKTFREFPEYVNQLKLDRKKKVAIFCTGGIRCEKASSYMLREGYEEVYHLKGGILKYLEELPPSESLWEGECFVFDERISVGHGVKESKKS